MVGSSEGTYDSLFHLHYLSLCHLPLFHSSPTPQAAAHVTCVRALLNLSTIKPNCPCGEVQIPKTDFLNDHLPASSVYASEIPCSLLPILSLWSC